MATNQGGRDQNHLLALFHLANQADRATSLRGRHQDQRENIRDPNTSSQTDLGRGEANDSCLA